MYDYAGYSLCTESIIASRHGGQQLQPLTRARRNMSDWMKLLSQTLLFNVSSDGNNIALSAYSIKERKSVDCVCKRLSDSSSFWIYKEENFKQDGSIITAIMIIALNISLRRTKRGGLSHARRSYDI